jgi:hypothetical protein
VTRLGRAWDLPLPAHAAAFGVLLLALTPVLRVDVAFTSDEGAYGLQAEALEDDTWEYDYAAAKWDPHGQYFPLVNSSRQGDRWFPYVKHPAYPLALQRLSEVAGESVGLHLLPLLGALLTAVAAWLLAGELHPALSRAAFWLAAAGPALVNAYVLWAHAPIAAASGLAAVGAVRIVRRGPTSGAVVLLLAGLAVAVLLRSEGLLFTVALAPTLVVACWRRHGTRVALAVGGAAAGVGVAVYLAERAWIRDILGGPFLDLTVRGSEQSQGYVGGRFTGAWHSLLSGSAGSDNQAAIVLIGLAILVVGVAVVRLGSPNGPQRLLFALVAAAVVYLMRLLGGSREPATGLIAAWPVVLVGLMFLGRRRLSLEAQFLAAATALFALAVLATQYGDGGAFNWGGRFFAPITAPLAALAVLGLRVALRPMEERERRRLGFALVALAVIPAVLGLVVLGRVRSGSEDTFVAIAARAQSPIVTSSVHLPRLMWDWEGLTWMRAPPEEIDDVVEHLRAGGVRRLTLVVAPDYEQDAVRPFYDVRDVTGQSLRGSGVRVLRLER